MIKKAIAIGTIVAGTVTLTACGTINQAPDSVREQTGTIVNLTTNVNVNPHTHDVFVKYNEGTSEDVVVYTVTEECFNKLSVGGTFKYDSEYVIDTGVVEYTITEKGE